MTLEELEALVAEGPTEALIAALSPMTESERKALSRASADIRRRLRRERDGDEFRDSDALVRSELAVCGLSSFTEAKSTRLLREWVRDLHESAIVQVLADRKPEWLPRLVDHDFERGRAFMRDRWSFARELVVRGAIDPPTNDAYIEAMVKTLSAAGWRSTRPLADRLREQRDLLEHDVWRIFEIEPRESGPFEGDVAGHDPRACWPRALAELAGDGDIDRDRLMDAIVRAFRSAPGMQRARFLVRVHRELRPTRAECAARREAYAEALGCGQPNVLAEAAKALARSRCPEAAEVAPYVRAAFAHDHKSAARAVLAVLSLLGVEGAVLAAHALASPLPGIQSEALDLIESLAVPPAPDVAAALRESQDTAVPSQRDRADALAATLSGESSAAHGPDRVESVVPLDEIRARASACPHLEVSGLAACLEGRIEPVRLHPFDVGRLREPIAPIETVEELVLEWVRHAEAQPEIERIERLLDATMRLCAEHPPDFEALIAPVRKAWMQRSHTWESPGSWEAPIARSWYDPFTKHANPLVEERRQPIRWFFGARLEEIAPQVRKRRPAQLLATPTHKGGWIDPRVFVRRLLASRLVMPADLVQALLRLAPDHRSEALSAAETVPQPLRGWVRFALGGDESLESLRVPPRSVEDVPRINRAKNPASFVGRLGRVARAVGLSPREPKETGKPTAQLLPRSALVAAVCRARDPWGTFSGGENEADVDTRAEYAWAIRPMRVTDHGRELVPGVDVRVQPTHEIDRTHESHVLTPTAAIHRRRIQRRPYASDEPSLDPRLAGVWPADPSGWLACGVRETVRRLDSSVSSYSPRSLRLEPFFDPDMPLTEIASVLLVLALCAKDEDLRATARDATIALTGDGRMDAALIGEIAASLVDGGVVKPGRLATSLAELAFTSLSTTYVVAVALGEVAIVCPPRSLIPVATTLRDAYSTLRSGPDDRVRKALSAVTGRGKAAKLAHEVASMSGPGRSDELMLEAMESRIARARRYEQLEWMPITETGQNVHQVSSRN